MLAKVFMCIHSVKYLGICYIPATVLGAGDTAVNNTACTWEIYMLIGILHIIGWGQISHGKQKYQFV